VSCKLFEKGGRSIFLGDAHATSLIGISIAELRSAGRARAPVPTWALLTGRLISASSIWKNSPIGELRSAGRARAPVPTWALLAGGEAACFYVGIADPTPDI